MSEKSEQETAQGPAQGGYRYDPRVDTSEGGRLQVKGKGGKMVDITPEEAARTGLTAIAAGDGKPAGVKPGPAADKGATQTNAGTRAGSTKPGDPPQS
jgi:hypothetical protein